VEGCDPTDGTPAASFRTGKAAPEGGRPRFPPFTFFDMCSSRQRSVEKNVKDGTPGGSQRSARCRLANAMCDVICVYQCDLWAAMRWCDVIELE